MAIGNVTINVAGVDCTYHRLEVHNENRMMTVQIGEEEVAINGRLEMRAIHETDKFILARVYNYISKNYYDSEIQAGRKPVPIGYTEQYVNQNTTNNSDLKHCYIDLCTNNKSSYKGGTEV